MYHNRRGAKTKTHRMALRHKVVSHGHQFMKAQRGSTSSWPQPSYQGSLHTKPGWRSLTWECFPASEERQHRTQAPLVFPQVVFIFSLPDSWPTCFSFILPFHKPQVAESDPSRLFSGTSFSFQPANRLHVLLSWSKKLSEAYGWIFTILCTWTGFVLLFVGLCWIIQLPQKAQQMGGGERQASNGVPLTSSMCTHDYRATDITWGFGFATHSPMMKVPFIGISPPPHIWGLMN